MYFGIKEQSREIISIFSTTHSSDEERQFVFDPEYMPVPRPGSEFLEFVQYKRK